MAIKSKFTKEEWQLIIDGPEWILAALAAADGNAAITTKAKESKAFKNAVKNYSSTSPAVKEVVADKAKPSKDVKKASLSDAEQALEEISELLDSKLTPKDANEYRKFLESVADSVAEAAGEGALGLGKKISKKEEKALGKIKEALKPTKAAQAKPPASIFSKPKPKTEQKPKTKPAAKPVQKPKPVAKKPVASGRPRPRPGVAGGVRPSLTKKEKFVGEHTVAAGETLSHISLKFYGSAAKAKYMAIYEANKDVIGDNPNIIKPGQVLKIPKID